MGRVLRVGFRVPGVKKLVHGSDPTNQLKLSCLPWFEDTLKKPTWRVRGT